MADVLVDTDVLIDHLRGHQVFRAGRARIHVSVVTRCELFAGRSADESVVRSLLAPFREIPVDREIAESAGRIRRDTGVPTPDALIAATALREGLPLLTRNRAHFERVARLRIRAPGTV